MTPNEIYARLRELAPSVVFSAERERDDSFCWDGDGPDPVENGFEAFDITVYAKAAVDGVLVEGRASLGGCYMLPDEELGNVGGYLPQMLEEAAKELYEQIPSLFGSVRTQLERVMDFLNQELRRRYAEQQSALADK